MTSSLLLALDTFLYSLSAVRYTVSIPLCGRLILRLDLSEKNPLHTLPYDATVVSLLEVFARGAHRGELIVPHPIRIILLLFFFSSSDSIELVRGQRGRIYRDRFGPPSFDLVFILCSTIRV